MSLTEPQHTTPKLAEQNRELGKMRRIATGVLAALAGTFVGTHFVPDPNQSVLLIRAMAEAGMVGGLADWFAVEALFRRPLGLPIPHTALLPSNQKRAAKNVGEFFDTYFMDPTQLRKNLAGSDPVNALATWLSDQKNAEFAAGQLTSILAVVFKSGLGSKFSLKSGDFLGETLSSAIDADVIAAQIGNALKGSLDSDLLDDLLKRVQTAIRNNHGAIIDMVQDRSRWWISSSIDERIAEVLVDGAVSVLQELSDERSDLRAGFKASIAGIIGGAERDGVISAQIEQGKSAFLGSEAFHELVTTLIENVQTTLTDTLKTDPKAISQSITVPLQNFAIHLTNDKELRDAFNAKLFDIVEILLVQLRPIISAYVTETIANWDSDELVDRFESAVGRDLQFIRINGAVLGSLIGAVLFGFSKLVA